MRLPERARHDRTSQSHLLRRPRHLLILRALLAVGVAAMLAVGSAVGAQADAFRFWGYYQWSDGAWAFAPKGAAETVPEDGATEGWRYAVGEESSTRLPRTGDVFADICGDFTADVGEKRVAVVIDYGTPEDAPEGDEPPDPRGDCAVVPDDATGADVLAAVAEIRLNDGGLYCGIDGYPSTDCGGAVDGQAPSGEEETVQLALPAEASPTAEPDADAGADAEAADDGGNQQLPLIIGIAVVVLIAVAGFAQARRSRSR